MRVIAEHSVSPRFRILPQASGWKWVCAGRPMVKAFPRNLFPDSLQNKESVKPAPNSKSNSLPFRLIFPHF